MNWRNRFVLISILLGGVALFLTSCGSTASHPQNKATSVPPSLFLLSKQGEVDAYHADGTRLWQGKSDDSDMPTSTGTHLIEAGRMLYVATNTVRAYSDDGQLRWQHDLPARADTSLIVGNVFYVAAGGTIIALDATTGTLRWLQENVASFPVDVILTSDTQNLYIGNRNQMTALNLQSGVREWTLQVDPGETIQSLSVRRDLVLIRTDASLTVVEATTGKMIWHRNSQVQALFLDPADIVYIVYIDPTTDPPSSGTQSLRLRTGERLWNVSSPVHDGENGSLSSTGIVWASANAITAWNLNGKQLWRIPYAEAPIKQAISSDGQRFFLLMTQEGTIMALDTQDGHQRWQQRVSGGNVQVVVQSALIWVLNKDTGEINAFDFDSTRRWSCMSPSPIEEMIIAEEKI